MDDKKNGTPGPPPKPVLVGTKMDICFKWGDGQPIVFKSQTVTGDKQKDTVTFGVPIQYPGAALKFVNPNNPKEVFVIFSQKPKQEFKDQIKIIKKPGNAN